MKQISCCRSSAVALLLLTTCVVLSTSYTTYPITTLINAKWNQTPIALEVAEYLADENSDLFWEFIDKVNALQTPIHTMKTDSKVYKALMKISEDLLGATQLPLLKLCLAMHTFSPRVQANLQIASDQLTHGDCKQETFVMLNGRLVCEEKEIKDALKNGAAEQPYIYGFDHIYPSTENHTMTAILYGQIGTKSFHKMYDYLKKQSEKSNLKYVVRHYVKSLSQRRVRLSGYGVELHLKSTEYKSQDDSPTSDKSTANESFETDTEIGGFDFKVLKERYPSLSHSLDRLKGTLLEKTEDIVPLKAWEFQELGLQAAQRIADIQGEEALQILQFTAQNFPTQAKSLSNQAVRPEFKKEMKHNIELLGRHLNIQPPDAALFINGLFYDADTLDVSSLVDTLLTEMRVLDRLHQLGVHGKIAASLLTVDPSTSSGKEFAIDIRDSAVLWINDLENDSQYRRWPSSVTDLLRPTFPGMLRNVRKNVFNLVLIVDTITTDCRGIIKLAESFVAHSAPLRLGFVFDSRKETAATEREYRAILCAFNYVTQQKTARDALGFLTDVYGSMKSHQDVTYQDIVDQMKKSFKNLSTDQIADILGEDSDFDYGKQLALEFLEKLGFQTLPQALLNGISLQQSLLNADDFEEIVLSEIMQQTPSIQKAVYKGDLSDTDNLIDYLMSQPHVMPRLNQRILSNEEQSFLDLGGKQHNDLENINGLMQLSQRDMTATLMGNMKYFTYVNAKHPEKTIDFVTLWVIADLDTDNGKALLENAFKYMKSEGGIRVAFLPNAEGSKLNDRLNLNRLVWAASHTLGRDEATNKVLEWFKQSDPKKFNIPSATQQFLSSTELHMKMLRYYSQKVLKLRASANAILCNGRLIGPLDDNEYLTTDDFGLMERFIEHQYVQKLRKVIESTDAEVDDVIITSDTVFKLVTILVPREQTRNRFTIPEDLQQDYTVVKLPVKAPGEPYFDIVAVVDPASRGAQKIAPILMLLRNVINCNMKVVMGAVEKHSDMPVKNFYRFVIEPELQFETDGKLTAGPYAKFIGIPINPLLTQSLQIPDNWMVEVVQSVYDVDNIKLATINGPVHSEYELEHLLLEGHCFDSTSGTSPRGLQITLGTQEQPLIVDTIVMANLGYFQLKANPGAWLLKLRQGKSSEIYDITSADGLNTVHSKDGTIVVINSMRSHVLKLRVSKKPDKLHADLLGEEEAQSSGIWGSITNTFGGGGDSTDEDTINIFSVASGHLYERLLRIMMLSLLKHTESPVKFWFLKNYLSPQFIDFLPYMAEKYGFKYELVQYKWPRWLHQQTEKQRVIWGYKILFLDVLFPLDVKKIIFVDADAIVRANIKELNTLDLNGAPYAYTPFCDSRKEMEGFRFWKQGYWKNHLQGRKYHISALYVVDLKRFRKIAAGDRLRGQYQALSQDPNSLSNLDQDLPNNMIHQVAIKSLPQEWLWCQTWCNDDSFKKAKAIDLCNNPLTKEAKLAAAQRIVPEWKDYDLEIKNLMYKRDEETEHEELFQSDDDVESSGSILETNKKHSEL